MSPKKAIQQSKLLQDNKSDKFKNPRQKISLSEHFLELKKRILISICSIIVCGIITYIFAERLIYWLCLPMMLQNPKIVFIYTELTAAFSTQMRLSFLGGVFLSSPMIVYQIWQFVAPGLLKKEKKILLMLICFSPILFLFGMCFAYLVVVPGVLQFFSSFDKHNTNKLYNLRLMPCIRAYTAMVINLMFSFGLMFQLPIVLKLLLKKKIITKKFLKQNRRYILLIIMILSAIITPPDVLSMLLLGIPVYCLYEISIFLN